MDNAVLDRAKAGDRDALEQVLEEVAPIVFRFGMRMCKHEADAEDVLQETLLAVTRHLGEFEGRSSFPSWVFTLARTACGRKRRGLKNQAFLPEEKALERASADEASPENIASEEQLREALRGALDTLSEEHREVILLRDMEGLTAPEVAETLGMSVDAVKSRLHRARSALREALRDVLERGAPKALPGCPDILAAFSQKLEGDLGSADCAAMEQHLATCPSCGAACSALRSALGACQAEASREVSPAVQTRIKAAIQAFSRV